jgi:hypothetical protein
MKTDPIIRQVRKTRHQIEIETQQDPDLYYQHLVKLQETFSERLVCRKPKLLQGVIRKKVA